MGMMCRYWRGGILPCVFPFHSWKILDMKLFYSLLGNGREARTRPRTHRTPFLDLRKEKKVLLRLGTGKGRGCYMCRLDWEDENIEGISSTFGDVFSKQCLGQIPGHVVAVQVFGIRILVQKEVPWTLSNFFSRSTKRID